MEKKPNAKRKSAPKRVLRLPDLDHAKRTVLNSLGSPDSTRAYAFAIDDFIAWYCSEPRLAFGNTLCCVTASSWSPGILRQRRSTCALRRCGAWLMRRPTAGLLSPELAAGVQRVKGAKRLGIRLGNWLTVEQCRTLLRAPDERT